MTGADWIAPVAAATGLLTALGGAFGYLITLLQSQSKDTISALTQDRDYWRDRAARCETGRRWRREGG